MPGEWKNKLYFGDNLGILRDHIADETVDLIYLDPPFNSNANYNVLYKEASGQRSAAQVEAFEDTWHWGPEADATYRATVKDGPKRLSDLLQAFWGFLGPVDMMAYLAMMAPRLVELRRVLKPTGSIYLHCDPTASHYLKLLLDAVFGHRHYVNEIAWKRSSAHSDTKQGMRRYGKIRDILFFYTNSNEYRWNTQYTPYDKEYLEAEYRHVAADGRRYKETDLTAAKVGGDTEYEWHVKRPQDANVRWEADLDNEYQHPKPAWEYRAVRPYTGRYWAYTKANLLQFAKDGLLVHRETGMPRLMQFADDMPGVSLQDLWDDIPPVLSSQDLGYQTQKPEALLERIIRASSNEGDLVLDPFCGCGTAVAVAERLHRRWLGIDITHLAITLIKRRLHDTFRSELAPYEVVSVPKDLESARALAEDSRHQFEWWALDLVDAQPAHDKKKGADTGVDGYIYFFDDNSGTPKKVVVQVKSGHVQAGLVRDLQGVVKREKAEIGVFVTLEPPTKNMQQEALLAGVYEPALFPGKEYPRLQVLTIEDLLSGREAVKLPSGAPDATFKKAERKSKVAVKQHALGL